MIHLCIHAPVKGEMLQRDESEVNFIQDQVTLFKFVLMTEIHMLEGKTLLSNVNHLELRAGERGRDRE